MNSLNLEQITAQHVGELQYKYASEGPNIPDQVEQLMYEREVDYTEYIATDMLLNLQKPKTHFPDEVIFITYHQISELYFKLILWELKQLSQFTDPNQGEVFVDKIKRINRYYQNLVSSFDIMVNGLDRAQFMKFRKALSPASGFQSLQNRLIEVHATDAVNLILPETKSELSGEESIQEIYERLYWKRGAIEMGSGRKSKSLVNFEKQYDALLQRTVEQFAETNLWQVYQKYYSESKLQPAIALAMREYDHLVNVVWKSSHFRVASRYLAEKGKKMKAGTGGTNWRKYLIPRKQKIIFFPGLWTDEEIANWGKITTNSTED